MGDPLNILKHTRQIYETGLRRAAMVVVQTCYPRKTVRAVVASVVIYVSQREYTGSGV